MHGIVFVTMILRIAGNSIKYVKYVLQYSFKHFDFIRL